MKFLGWDCATKSLAWSYLDIDISIFDKIIKNKHRLYKLIDLYCGNNYAVQMKSGGVYNRDIIYAKFDNTAFITDLIKIIDTLYYELDNFIKCIDIGVTDILNGKKCKDSTIIERTKALNDFIQSNDKICSINDTVVIIEHQPQKIGTKTNNQSSAISHQLAYHYIAANPIMIHPKHKNTISFKTELSLDYITNYTLPRYKNSKDAKYAARKKHSRENFIYILDVFKLSSILNDISRTNFDDVADSTMQIFAYIRNNIKQIKL